jgi:hypothetical protein
MGNMVHWEDFWNTGDTVILRNIARSDGSVTTAVPAIVIRDGQDLLAVYIAKGTPFKNNWVVPPAQRVASVVAIVPSAQRQHRDLAWWYDSIRLYLPGYSYSIWLNFDESGEFASYYCNLEAPFIRTELGIDTRDFALDIIAKPDGQWWWKDEEEFKRRLETGLDSAAHQAQVRAVGRDFIRAWKVVIGPLTVVGNNGSRLITGRPVICLRIGPLITVPMRAYQCLQD